MQVYIHACSHRTHALPQLDELESCMQTENIILTLLSNISFKLAGEKLCFFVVLAISLV